MTERYFDVGDTILAQGERAEDVYLLLAGEVEVVQFDEQQRCHQITRFQPGALFGERALLTGEARSAAVLACCAVRTARLTPDHFNALLRLDSRIYANLSCLLARQLGNWSRRHQREERENRELLHHLVGWQVLPEFDSFPGVSDWARQINLRLHQLTDSRQHVLISGEPGTWKELAARLIHFYAQGQERPILYFDCLDPPPVLRRQDGQRGLLQDELLLALAQEAALFGHQQDSEIYAEGTGRGFIELASGGELIVENIHFLAPGVQRRLVEYLRTEAAVLAGDGGRRVRFIATSEGDIHQLVAEGHFSVELREALRPDLVELRPLRERAKDVPVIAKRLLLHLNHKHHKQLRGFTQEALNLLVDYHWPLNGQELQQVLDRAVALAPGPRVQAEHIFLNITPASGEGRLNLLHLPLVRKAFSRENFPVGLRYLTLPIFLLVLMACFTGGAMAAGANYLVWILWWPALLISIIFSARSWCSFCPLSALGSWLEKLTGHKKLEPLWLRRHGVWFAVATMVMIVVVEHVFDFFHWPLATGILLASLLLLTLFSAAWLGVRSWCRYLCPLGVLVGTGARASLLELRSNLRVCQSQCRADDCIRRKECPMGLHPSALGTTDDCILCGVCFRHCPHDAISINLRYPWLGLTERAGRGWVAQRLAVVLPPLFALLFALFFQQMLDQISPLLQPLFDLFSADASPQAVDLRILQLVPLLVSAGAAFISWRAFRDLGGR
jgi:transcriptional regulator with AAA-type ATPase domain/NAD-dependent dihydropyrimidine dehydrogenase PreA subunit